MFERLRTRGFCWMVCQSSRANIVRWYESDAACVGGNRGTPTTPGRRNEIAVFRINEATGEPALIQNADTHGFTPRTFSLDPSGRVLVVGNQNSVSVSDGGSTTLVPANLAVFRAGNDGTLTFVQRYDVGVGRKPLWWMGLVALP